MRMSLSAGSREGDDPLLQSRWNERPPGGMADVQDVDGIAADSIENPKGIADDRNDANGGMVGNPRRGLGHAPNSIEHGAKSFFYCLGYRWTCVRRIVSRDLLQVSQRSPRPDKLHFERNLAKTASTSSSVATSPASMEAIAASIASNSSRVATYSSLRISFSICSATATSSSCAASGHA